MASSSDDDIVCLFQPDTLLAEQYFEDRRGQWLGPEKGLVLAILEDAILTFQENHAATHGKEKRLFEDARAWLFNASDDWVFSFENICHVLEFKPEYIRKGLAQWREKESAKPPLWQGKKIASEMRV
jgi:hypothetical protein